MKAHQHTHHVKSAQQRGMTLFIALIGLIGMAIAAVALIRVVDTNSLIAGNLSFRKAALHASDAGIEDAYATLDTMTSTQLEQNSPNGCSNACKYYALIQAEDVVGLPAVVSWADIAPTTVNDDFQVKYVIERLCSGSLPIADLASNCYAEIVKKGGSKKLGSTVFSVTNQLFFRVTVRVEGPRNTVTYTQAILSR